MVTLSSRLLRLIFSGGLRITFIGGYKPILSLTDSEGFVAIVLGFCPFFHMKVILSGGLLVVNKFINYRKD